MRTLLIVVYPDPFEAIRATAFGCTREPLPSPTRALPLRKYHTASK